jgi:large subunit ribosomal protein L28
MMKCYRCGKGVQVGMNVSHSHIRTKKRSRPNLHVFNLKVSGMTKRVRLCTKCLRIVKKEIIPKVANKPVEIEEKQGEVIKVPV